MLTDEHIQAAQNKQFEHLAGLQSTQLFQNKGHSPALISDGSFRKVCPYDMTAHFIYLLHCHVQLYRCCLYLNVATG